MHKYLLKPTSSIFKSHVLIIRIRDTQKPSYKVSRSSTALIPQNITLKMIQNYKYNLIHLATYMVALHNISA